MCIEIWQALGLYDGWGGGVGEFKGDILEFYHTFEWTSLEPWCTVLINVLEQTRPIYNVINISFYHVYSVHPFQGASFFYLKFILRSFMGKLHLAVQYRVCWWSIFSLNIFVHYFNLTYSENKTRDSNMMNVYHVWYCTLSLYYSM